MKIKKNLMQTFLLSIGTCLLLGMSMLRKTEDGWIDLFNGKNLDGWIVKIAKHETGENYGETFRVKDGQMQVSYENYTDFDFQYGHIFYEKPFSYYLIEIEYKFFGDQAPKGEGWAWRNSGVMLHGQSPYTMTKEQDFPISIEAQFLGGDGKNNRTTCNLCTPGTHVVMEGKLITQHCITSKSKTFHGDQWVNAKFLVLGDSIIKHFANDELVLSYEKPQFGGGTVNRHNPAEKRDGELIKAGYISLQSESHPISFRKVRIYNLEKYATNTKKLSKKLEDLKIPAN
ncbi:MAG: hypothetical protein RLZZ417_920 [Bacteroidota bacterium]|jgi:hypothetical protein